MSPGYKSFGTSSAFSAAFPNIEEISVTVRQDPNGYYCFHEWQREHVYTRATLPSLFRCANARCQDGGIAVQQLILEQGSGNHDLPCAGREPKATGQSEGDPCENRFKIALAIQQS
jgi:hypothetical protein